MRVLPERWSSFSRAVTTKSAEDISKKMVASKQNKSEKILSIFLTKIPIPAAASVFSITPCDNSNMGVFLRVFCVSHA